VQDPVTWSFRLEQSDPVSLPIAAGTRHHLDDPMVRTHSCQLRFKEIE
jgi:hypothetical protein